MNAMTRIEPADDINTFLPGIGAAEYQRRAKIRSLRNAASAMIGTTDCDASRQLAWLASDYATEVIYMPAHSALLDEVARLCQRLMLTALQAERLAVLGATYEGR